ncbi:Ger(x)C family spore germination protein [Paenibacillus sp. CF384]|uniref:Ger(x)C family spore germination protein n=1 Tax=Paenibacillus sp. CF384 TaxID=1884382 RepID=UPI000894E190|nr:Ger(x)C family spore germination protein [Paenibacillus sp. CF384]SDX50597.1 spore germination protein KC [Paenibacillus sp. CF384]
MMVRFTLLLSVAAILLLSLSGCTDFIEPNQLAIILGTAVDHAEGDNIEISNQIVIPSQLNGSNKGGGSGGEDNYIVVSATGRNVFDASQKIQGKISRRLMTSHRILIAVGEEFFAKHELNKLFDKLGRDPANNLRDTIVIVRGSSAKEFLKLKHPMEYNSSVAAGKEMQINGLEGFTSRHIVIESLAQGTRPFIPYIQIQEVELNSKKKTPIAAVAGFAVMDKNMRIKGFLNAGEGALAIWMIGKGSNGGITIPSKNGKGVLSFRLTHQKRRIHAGNDPAHVVLTVKAQAYLLENSTSLDMSKSENMVALQRYLNKQIQKELQQTMGKIQHFGPDVIGIGEYLHRKYPYWWKTQKADWDNNFKKIDVTIQAKIQLRSTGVTGAPLD